MCSCKVALLKSDMAVARRQKGMPPKPKHPPPAFWSIVVLEHYAAKKRPDPTNDAFYRVSPHCMGLTEFSVCQMLFLRDTGGVCFVLASPDDNAEFEDEAEWWAAEAQEKPQKASRAAVAGDAGTTKKGRECKMVRPHL